MNRHIRIFDSTLRDGAQGEGVTFSVQDKLNVTLALDELGIAYIEAGNPGSNPKDMEFFEKANKLKLKNARLVAFGSTRRKNTKAENDETMQSLLSANTEAVAIFGKTWDFHVTDIINTTLDENIRMISDSIQYMKSHGKEVIFDAEHFFDGFQNNKEYAMRVLSAVYEAGADCISLCDTKGGAFPEEVYAAVKLVCEMFSDIVISIHCHNDRGLAVANSIMAVRAGASEVQGTYIGIGERCGNTNLSTVIPNLQMGLGISCIPDQNMAELTSKARYIAEIANTKIDRLMPYVGRSAFSHKAGMHSDGVKKNAVSFEHIPPESVGNERRFLISEIAGRAALLTKINKFAPELSKDSPQTKSIISKIKKLEHKGYQFEAAESSLELIICKELGMYDPFFELVNFKIIGEQPVTDSNSAVASIKIKVGDNTEITSDEGDGPVNALDKALRKAIEVFYPEIAEVQLIDYKVRVMDSNEATASRVRVLMESTDGENVWTTVGASTDVIKASWYALVDSIDYKLMMPKVAKIKGHN